MRGGEGIMGPGSSLSKAPEMEETCVHGGCVGSGCVSGVGLESQDGDQGERRWEDRAGGG